MKYIRTEDGRIKNKYKIICYAFREDYISPNWNDDIEKYLQTKIVAEANTIEELCDEFVIKVGNEYLHAKYYHIDKTFYIYNTDEEISLEECLRFNYIIYGGIWTNKGFIYQAKMKGVLPNGEIDWVLI